MRGHTTILHRTIDRNTRFRVGLTLLACIGFAACEGAPAPLRPTVTAYRGQRAREFPNLPNDVWEAARATLVEEGYVIREDDPARGFLHAHTIPNEAAADGTGADRTWSRVTARVTWTDHHKRAPRSLLEVEAERMTGNAEGVIEAASGAMTGDYYERFFRSVESRLPQPRLPQLAIPGFE